MVLDFMFDMDDGCVLEGVEGIWSGPNSDVVVFVFVFDGICLTPDTNVSELCGLVQMLMLLYLFLYLMVLYLTLDVSETELCGVFQILMVISLSLCLM